jgi:hypothetical protein
MRVESREVGFWLVAKRKRGFLIFQEGGSEDEEAYIVNDFCIGGGFVASAGSSLTVPGGPPDRGW